MNRFKRHEVNEWAGINYRQFHKMPDVGITNGDAGEKEMGRLGELRQIMENRMMALDLGDFFEVMKLIGREEIKSF